MLRPKLSINPPKWVPGPFRAPRQPPAVPTQRLPVKRYYTATGNETLAGLAERYYGSSKEAIRIFNANRLGMLRDDKTTGMLHSPQEVLTAGTIILIP